MGSTFDNARNKDSNIGNMYRLVTCYGSVGNDFLQSTVTGDKSWVHHHDPEIKSQ